ncbi:MAG TPA: hypothetical protein VGL72_02040 [Bryobacteraceae bacterium]|jgi:hypothetical protein
MRILAIALLLTFTAGCSRDDRHQTPGEAAGKAAYNIEKGVKKASKEISKDVKSFSRDAHQGFQEEKKKDLQRKREKDEK